MVLVLCTESALERPLATFSLNIVSVKQLSLRTTPDLAIIQEWYAGLAHYLQLEKLFRNARLQPRSNVP